MRMSSGVLMPRAIYYMLQGQWLLVVQSRELACYLSSCAGVIWYKYLSRLVSSRPYARAECDYSSRSVPVSESLVLSAA